MAKTLEGHPHGGQRRRLVYISISSFPHLNPLCLLGVTRTSGLFALGLRSRVSVSIMYDRELYPQQILLHHLKSVQSSMRTYTNFPSRTNLLLYCQTNATIIRDVRAAQSGQTRVSAYSHKLTNHFRPKKVKLYSPDNGSLIK